MQNLKMDEKQRDKLGRELEKLFTLKGLYFKGQTEKQIDVLLDDPSILRFGFNDILAGVKRLQGDDWDLKAITNHDIVNSIKSVKSVNQYIAPAIPDENDYKKSRELIERCKNKYGCDWWKHLSEEASIL